MADRHYTADSAAASAFDCPVHRHAERQRASGPRVMLPVRLRIPRKSGHEAKVLTSPVN